MDLNLKDIKKSEELGKNSLVGRIYGENKVNFMGAKTNDDQTI